MILVLHGLFLNPDYQQSIMDIKSSSTGITGKISNGVYQQDKLQLKKLTSIFNLDLQGFNETEKQSGPGSDSKEIQIQELTELRNQMISTTFTLDFEPDYLNERSVPIEYNPEDKTISVSNEVNNEAFFDDPQYLQIDQFLFRCPDGILVTKKNFNYACVDIVAETISFKIADESIASKIEQARDHLRLLFVFNITGTVNNPGKISTSFYFTTYLQKVLAYNSGTNEIYSVYGL